MPCTTKTTPPAPADTLRASAEDPRLASVKIAQRQQTRCATLCQSAAQLSGRLTTLHEKQAQIVAQMLELHQAGMTDAGIHMRAGVYMYLVHPTQADGTRIREYIGADPARQAAARARIERRQQFAHLNDQLEAISNRISRAEVLLDQLETLLK